MKNPFKKYGIAWDKHTLKQCKKCHCMKTIPEGDICKRCHDKGEKD